MRNLWVLLIGSCYLFAGQVSATIIKYDYQFDTPVFSEPLYATLNTLLSGAGSTITGSITIDTDKIFSSSGGLDTYHSNNGGFVHSGELDTLGFDTNADRMRVYTATNNLYDIFNWVLNGTDRNLFFSINFGSMETTAVCSVPGSTICNGDGFDSDSASFSNFSVTKTIVSGSVPEPTTLVLMGAGIVGLGFKRRRMKS